MIALVVFAPRNSCFSPDAKFGPVWLSLCFKGFRHLLLSIVRCNMSKMPTLMTRHIFVTIEIEIGSSPRS
jgi:hypothetical protein